RSTGGTNQGPRRGTAIGLGEFPSRSISHEWEVRVGNDNAIVARGPPEWYVSRESALEFAAADRNAVQRTEYRKCNLFCLEKLARGSKHVVLSNGINLMADFVLGKLPAEVHLLACKI